MTIDFKTLSDHLASTVETVGKSLVNVRAGRRSGTGTVWTADAIIIANHAIRRDEGIELTLHDGTTHAATLVGRDPTTDLAVLSTDAELTVPEKGPADELRVGHLALTLGRPWASVRATLGMVSAVSDAWRTPTGGLVDRYIEIDGTLPTGFSGGALVDDSSRVVAINTSDLLRSGASLPVTTVDRVVATLQEHGTVRRGFLGVGVQRVDVAESTGQSRGLLITAVEEDGPAQQAGLLVGDILLTVDDDEVTHFKDLIAVLAGRVDNKVAVRVVRGGKVKKITATVGERPAGPKRRHHGCR